MIIQRIKNLWQLSNFVITKFDHTLIITKDNSEKLEISRSKQAKIIEKDNPLDLINLE